MQKLTIHERLVKGAAVLDTINYCREVSGNPTLGKRVEQVLIERELADIVLATRIAYIDAEIGLLRMGPGRADELR